MTRSVTVYRRSPAPNLGTALGVSERETNVLRVVTGILQGRGGEKQRDDATLK